MNSDIVDLDKVPRNAHGLVDCAADLCILRPVDPSRGNRRMFFDYGNRGNKRCLQYFCDAPASNDPLTREHAGNGFLFRRGYTVVWLAWQGDLLPGSGRMIPDVPVATESDKRITGTVRTELIPAEAGQASFPLSGFVSTQSYPADSMDTREARLTRRRYATSEREGIAADAWAFARVDRGAGIEVRDKEIAVVPSRRHVYLPSGFEPGWIYEIVYTARDPLVLGLGHAVVRDTVSFLRYRDSDDAGNENPLAGRIDKAYAWGRSQAGRAIREFAYAGHNADVEGRKVFDGLLPHVSGGGKLERLCRYIARPAIANERLSLTGQGNVRYRLKTPYRDGTTQVIFEPLGEPKPK